MKARILFFWGMLGEWIENEGFLKFFVGVWLRFFFTVSLKNFFPVIIFS